MSGTAENHRVVVDVVGRELLSVLAQRDHHAAPTVQVYADVRCLLHLGPPFRRFCLGSAQSSAAPCVADGGPSCLLDLS
jgi:hypothetical protein